VESQLWSKERKIATVLFADLVSSTSFASGEDPEQTRVLLEHFYDAVSEDKQGRRNAGEVRGRRFFDRPHATGHAPDGIELHPVLFFSSSDCS
jgi:hypothetical protein